MVLAIVDVVDARVVFHGIEWAAFLQHWVARLYTRFALWKTTLVAYPSEIIPITAELVFQICVAELFQAFVFVAFHAFVCLRCVGRHIQLALDEFTAHAELLDVVNATCMHCSYRILQELVLSTFCAAARAVAPMQRGFRDRLTFL